MRTTYSVLLSLSLLAMAMAIAATSISSMPFSYQGGLSQNEELAGVAWPGAVSLGGCPDHHALLPSGGASGWLGARAGLLSTLQRVPLGWWWVAGGGTG